MADNSFILHEIAEKIANDETYRDKISKGTQVSVERPHKRYLQYLYISKNPEGRRSNLEEKYFQKNDIIGYLDYRDYDYHFDTYQIYAPIDGRFIPKDEVNGRDLSWISDKYIIIGTIYSDEYFFYTNYRDEIESIVKSILKDRELLKKQKEDDERRAEDEKRKEKEEQKRIVKDAANIIERCMLPLDAAIENKEKIELSVLEGIEKALQKIGEHRDNISVVEPELEHYRIHFETVHKEYIKYPNVSSRTAKRMSTILDRFYELLGYSQADIKSLRNERTNALNDENWQKHIIELCQKIDDAIVELQESWKNNESIDDVHLKTIDDILHNLLQEKDKLKSKTLIEKSENNLESLFCECKNALSYNTKIRMARLLDLFNEVIGMTPKGQQSLVSQIVDEEKAKIEADRDIIINEGNTNRDIEIAEKERQIKEEAIKTTKEMFTSYLQFVSENHRREIEALLTFNENRKEKFLFSLESARTEKKHLIELSRDAKGQDKQNYLDESREIEETIQKLQTEDKEADEALAGKLAMLHDKQEKEMQNNPIKLTNIDTLLLSYTGDEQK